MIKLPKKDKFIDEYIATFVNKTDSTGLIRFIVSDKF
jgi:hypothetical protein